MRLDLKGGQWSLVLVVLVATIFNSCNSRKPWTGMDHGHGHGWLKLHSNRHHDASSKLSEAYVKFHKLGDQDTKGGNQGGKGGFLSKLFGGGGSKENEQSSSGGGWGGQTAIVQMMVPLDGGGGGWGQQQQEQKPMMMEGGGWGMMMGGSNMMMGGWGSGGGGQGGGKGGGGKGGGGGARPTGWASPGGSIQGIQMIQMQQPAGWAGGDFSKFKPSKGSGSSKGHMSWEFPTGKPAYIQKLKPILDLPKFSKGWGWGR